METADALLARIGVYASATVHPVTVHPTTVVEELDLGPLDSSASGDMDDLAVDSTLADPSLENLVEATLPSRANSGTPPLSTPETEVTIITVPVTTPTTMSVGRSMALSLPAEGVSFEPGVSAEVVPAESLPAEAAPMAVTAVVPTPVAASGIAAYLAELGPLAAAARDSCHQLAREVAARNAVHVEAGRAIPPAPSYNDHFQLKLAASLLHWYRGRAGAVAIPLPLVELLADPLFPAYPAAAAARAAAARVAARTATDGSLAAAERAGSSLEEWALALASGCPAEPQWAATAATMLDPGAAADAYLASALATGSDRAAILPAVQSAATLLPAEGRAAWVSQLTDQGAAARPGTGAYALARFQVRARRLG